MRFALQLVCWLMLALTSARAHAAPQVVVLQLGAGALETWPQGTQAVIAELVASSYELVVRASESTALEGLERELMAAGQPSSIIGAVAVLRQGTKGLALVYTSRSGLSRIEVEAPEGTIAEGRLALRVVELLRTLDVPAASGEPSTARSPAAGKARPRAQVHPFEIRAGVGLAFSSGATSAFPLVAIGGSALLAGPLGVDLELRATPVETSIETSAGTLDARAEQLAAHLTFDAASSRHFRLALGLGASGLWMQAAAADSQRFSGESDETRVLVVSARARASVRAGVLSLSLAAEPGLALPAVSVRASDDAVERLGRPWFCTIVGVGWAP